MKAKTIVWVFARLAFARLKLAAVTWGYWPARFPSYQQLKTLTKAADQQVPGSRVVVVLS
jgi:hypothetical protein